MSIKQKGFGAVEAVLGCLVALLILAGGWLIVHNSRSTWQPGKTTGYLVIKEWTAKFPLTQNIKDAYYTYDEWATVTVSTHSLDKLVASVDGCKSGLTRPVYSRLKPGQHYAYSSAIFDPAGNVPSYKLDGYYIVQEPLAVSACAVESTATTTKAAAILYELSTQIAHVSPAE